VKAKQHEDKKEQETALKKSGSSMEVDAEDKASVVNSVAEVATTLSGGVDGANTSGIATPGTTLVGSTADSIAPSDLASVMTDVDEPGGRGGEEG